MLYPLKFKPILKEKIWGGQKIKTYLNKDTGKLLNCGESWEISGVEGDVSVVSNGILHGNPLDELIEIYMGDLVGEKIFEKFGQEFPLLIKFIDTSEFLSVQVHPDDETAKKRHNAYGKTEMWYMLEAEPGATNIVGFSKRINAAELQQHLHNKTLAEVLNFRPCKAGDVCFIPSGKVHATGKGILLAEIQQTSDITYRIYDWDRVDDQGKPRELHTRLALDVIDFEPEDGVYREFQPKLNETTQLAECKYFTTNLIEFDTTQHIDYSWLDSFVIYICTEGKTEVHGTGFDTMYLTAGETLLIPACFEHINLTPSVRSKLLEVYIDA